jgi:hypothetical protein
MLVEKAARGALGRFADGRRELVGARRGERCADEGVAIARPRAGELRELARGAGGLPPLQAGVGRADGRVEALRLACQRLAKRPLGSRELSAAVERAPEPDARVHVAGVGPQVARVEIRGAGVIAGLEGAVGILEDPGRVLRRGPTWEERGERQQNDEPRHDACPRHPHRALPNHPRRQNHTAISATRTRMRASTIG